jgi:hypothetical protein
MTAKTPSKTDPHFAPRKKGAAATPYRGSASDILAADILAFERAGGVVEKLGTTYTFKHTSATEPAAPAQVRKPGKAPAASS